MVEVIAKKITVQAFQEMEFSDDNPFVYELINGALMQRQIHKPLQQRVSRHITSAFDEFLVRRIRFWKRITVKTDRRRGR